MVRIGHRDRVPVRESVSPRNVMPCFLALAAAFFGSHLNLMPSHLPPYVDLRRATKLTGHEQRLPDVPHGRAAAISEAVPRIVIISPCAGRTSLRPAQYGCSFWVPSAVPSRGARLRAPNAMVTQLRRQGPRAEATRRAARHARPGAAAGGAG